MKTTARKTSRLRRLRASIGALLATLALTAAVGVAVPASASAMTPIERCGGWLSLGHQAEAGGHQALARSEEHTSELQSQR